MKAMGEAALELPWLPPCAASLAALTGPHAASVWEQVRHDPGCVLLLVRAGAAATGTFLEALRDPAVLWSAQTHLQHAPLSLMNWHQPGLYRTLQVAVQQARLASELAAHVAGCDADRAWAGGLLAPLGWLVIAARDAEHMPDYLARLVLDRGPPNCQRERWGIDPAALARRLAATWRLPPWLVPIVGHLGLHSSIAARLGADVKLFQIVQLAVAWLQQREGGLHLPVGSDVDELLPALGLTASLVERLAEKVQREPAPLPAADAAVPPALLADLLRLAGQQRHQAEATARLQHDLDQLQQALEQQTSEERERLHAKKLSALAELAAGAGHEINNPLAVISGQAQYLLKQIELAEEQLVEDPSPTLYLDTLKTKLTKALTAIVGQTHRIHHVLTDLMQFARPTAARVQTHGAGRLVQEVAAVCHHLAQERRVRLVCHEPAADLAVSGDLGQLRTALLNLLRNAVESAAAEGWAGIRVEPGPERIDFIVEDNGPGPAPNCREHLFDPFYSGRAAGRGRGLGLPTAWRLARNNGGDVVFAGTTAEATRFVLSLPRSPEAAPAPPSHGNGHHPARPRNGVHVARSA